MTDVLDLDRSFHADPHSWYRALRERGPVHQVRLDTGQVVWFLLGHAENKQALVDPRLSRDPLRACPAFTATASGPKGHSAVGRHLLITDEPEALRLRRVVSGAFTRTRVAAMRPRISAIVDGLLDEITSAARVDLTERFANPLAGALLCDLLGIPQLERGAVLGWVRDLVHAGNDLERQIRATAALIDWLDRFLAYKNRFPGEDLTSEYLRLAESETPPISGEELPAMLFMLLLAGYQTTASFLTNAVHTLLAHPGELAALRADPSLMDNAIEELARYEGSANFTTVRFTRSPVRLGGVDIPGDGTPVYLSLAAANRDPTRFPDPDRLDLRRDTSGHLAFGHGSRYCVGARLGRLQARLALSALLERFPALAPVPDLLEWQPGLLFRSLRHLPVLLRAQ